jgi:hypothetical protein
MDPLATQAPQLVANYVEIEKRSLWAIFSKTMKSLSPKS